MVYNIEFVKISRNHKFAGVGFAGNIFIILNALAHIKSEDQLFVDMETNECVCYEKNQNMYPTKNCWEYYFNQITLDNKQTVMKINNLLPAILKYDHSNSFKELENFQDIKTKFWNNFSLKDEINNVINDFFIENLLNKVTLGVQIRLTDMKANRGVKSISFYIERIKQILSEKPDINQIFISTDDIESIKTIESSIELPIIFHKEMFRADRNNPHLNPYDRYENNRELHKYKLALECLQEIFTLTKCDYFLMAEVSAISMVTCILSEKIKKVYSL